MKATALLFLIVIAPSLAADAIRMDAMGWLKDSERKQARDLGLGEMKIRLTVFNDGDVPITVPSVIIDSADAWNSLHEPTLILSYSPYTLATKERKQYPIVPSREAFAPVTIRPGECANVDLAGVLSWSTKAGDAPSAVLFRTKGFLADRLGFTAVELKSALQIVDMREPVRRTTISPTADKEWLQVDEGFQFLIPAGWRDKEARGIDSHVGHYEGPRAYLEFDDVFGLGYTAEESRKAIDGLSKKEANRKLMAPGEEVWRIDGRIARVTFAKVDPKVFGDREYPNVASLHVPYEGPPGYLEVHLFYADEAFRETARRILRSFTWPKKRPAAL